MNDVISLDELQAVVRRNARFEASAPPATALATTVQYIRENPAFAQSRLLGRVLHALACDGGEFRRAEASVFDAATLRLVVALMEAARSQTNTRAEWVEADAAAQAAADG